MNFQIFNFKFEFKFNSATGIASSVAGGGGACSLLSSSSWPIVG
jgi:hypothetical protein